MTTRSLCAGACAALYVEPAGALAIGGFSGVLSVLGYVYFTPYLQRTINLYDTCGIHNLHGMPGVLSAICSAIIVRVSQQESSFDLGFQTGSEVVHDLLRWTGVQCDKLWQPCVR